MLHPWIAIRQVIRANGTKTAESLAFKTLWSIVPTVVLLTAVMGALGYLDLLILIVPEIWGWLRINVSMDEFLSILYSARKFDFTTLGMVGAGVLLFTFYNLIWAIDDAINYFWHIGKSRPIKQSLLLYLPFILLLALSLILISRALAFGQKFLAFVLKHSSLPGHLDAQFQSLFFIGFLAAILTVFIYFLFQVLPRTRVRFSAAFWAALSTSGVLMVFLGGVSLFQSLLFKNYKAYWGSMALLPIFLLLLYGFWLIVLWGSALCRQLNQGEAGLLRKHVRTPEALEQESEEGSE